MRLEDLAASEPAFAGINVRARVLAGESAEALSKFQKHEEIDLVVIASHGHTGIQHFLLGSFAAKALQLMSCPVLLYRVTREAAERGKAAFHPGRILVPQDFSRASAGAADVACAWSREFKAEARLLFVVERLASLYGYLSGSDDGVAQYLEKVCGEGRDRLARLLREGWEGVRAEPKARIGHPAVEILREAEEYRADLIIMASRGLSGLERLAMGSVAERTIQGATCPVLVVKQQDQAKKWFGMLPQAAEDQPAVLRESVSCGNGN
jgi:nucleotide-binding universal stress UspA family protein